MKRRKLFFSDSDCPECGGQFYDHTKHDSYKRKFVEIGKGDVILNRYEVEKIRSAMNVLANVVGSDKDIEDAIQLLERAGDE